MCQINEIEAFWNGKLKKHGTIYERAGLHAAFLGQVFFRVCFFALVQIQDKAFYV